MKKLVFIVLLVALLLSLTLSVVMAGMDWDDPCTPGWDEQNGHGKCFDPGSPPGLRDKGPFHNGPGKAGDNWVIPPWEQPQD
ncbi:MAG: hypothetical protein HY782_15745 [Chloroflexi bacterium]|nr:hypothetical protein [Chloroflexota bacterium]